MQRVRVLTLSAAVCLLLLGCEADTPASPPAAPRPPTSAPAPAAGPTPVAAGPVLPPAARAAALPDRDALVRALATRALGARPGAVVLDAGTGSVLLDVDAARPRTPASVLKILTGAAVLTTTDPGLRLRTTVVDPGNGRSVVLVGGGDSTLTAGRAAAAYPRRTSLRDLADATTAVLKGDGRTSVRLLVDDALYDAPRISPHWRATYVRSGVVAPVSALMVDGARLRHGLDGRAVDPAVAAGRSFARLLARRGVEVTSVARGEAAPGASELAAVESAPVAQLVEEMLTTSDNDLAESLLRQVALSSGGPADFESGASAVAGALHDLGLDVTGLRMLDGSGLARRSRLPPRLVAQVLALAADPAGDRRLDPLLAGLPVAGFTGTLADRFDRGALRAAAGVTRAKTGTLTGVSTLAGVTSRDGAPLVVVVLADRVPGDTLAARAALDRFLARLVAGPARGNSDG